MNFTRLLLAFVLAPISISEAALKLPAIFGDHMVLQQKLANPIWGWDTPGRQIVVTFAQQSHSTNVGSDGKWTVRLNPEPASTQPRILMIEGSSMREIKDVLVGEVWMCSGQSNMAFRVANNFNGEVEVAAAHWPKIRLIRVPSVGTQELQSDFVGEWRACTPESARTFSPHISCFLRPFSGVCRRTDGELA